MFGSRTMSPIAADHRVSQNHALVALTDPDAADVLCSVLSERGHAVSRCADGETAWALLLIERFSLVFVDVALPGLDGLALCRRLLALPGGADAEVIAVSAEWESDELARALAAGVSDVISTPFEQQQLTARLAIAEQRLRIVRQRSDHTASGRPVDDFSSGELLRLLMDQLPDPIAFKDTELKFIRLNRAAAKLLGLDDPAAAIGLSDRDFFPPVLAAAYADDDRQIMATGVSAIGQVQRIEKPGGTDVWLSLTKAPTYGPDGTVSGVVVIAHDVTERIWIEEELRFQSELLDHALAAVIATDSLGNVTHWNRHAERLFGWTRGEAVGQSARDLLVDPTDAEFVGTIAAQIRRGENWEGEFVYRCKDRSTIHVRGSSSAIYDARGACIGVVNVSIDISERRVLEDRLYRMAYFDSLTGLANRTAFLEKLQTAIADGVAGVVLFFDLDRFKVVNDSLGHDAGDQLLVLVAQRLGSVLRSKDLLARFGGDEFAAFLPGTEVETSGFVAERCLAALADPFDIGGTECFAGASVGIAPVKPLVGSPSEILRVADVALYDAKGAGRGRWSVFDASSDDLVSLRLRTETELRRAIDRNELVVYYQPVIELATGITHGFEALVRWNHPERGFLPPGDFLPLAEETGLIVPLGEWVLGQACREAVIWGELAPERPPVVAVNVSPRQFHNQSLLQCLWRTLGETNLPPHRLKLEVTEEALANDLGATAAFLRVIKDLDVRLALDDFGAGHSSLGRLYRLPLDVLKLDRSFISGLGTSLPSEAFIRAVVALARELGLAVTAEGIETEDQRRLVTALGCDRGQGYLFGRPMPAADAITFLKNSRSIIRTAASSAVGAYPSASVLR